MQTQGQDDNKYAEGYPNKRYGGCDYVDVAEVGGGQQKPMVQSLPMFSRTLDHKLTMRCFLRY